MRQPSAAEMVPLEVRFRHFDQPLLQFLKVVTSLPCSLWASALCVPAGHGPRDPDTVRRRACTPTRTSA